MGGRPEHNNNGNPPMKKPKVVPKATTKAIVGEMNIAMKITTWLAKVNDAGSITILIGENIGIIKPIAISKPAMVSFFMFCVSIINLSFSLVI